MKHLLFGALYGVVGVVASTLTAASHATTNPILLAGITIAGAAITRLLHALASKQ